MYWTVYKFQHTFCQFFVGIDSQKVGTQHIFLVPKYFLLFPLPLYLIRFLFVPVFHLLASRISSATIISPSQFCVTGLIEDVDCLIPLPFIYFWGKCSSSWYVTTSITFYSRCVASSPRLDLFCSLTTFRETFNVHLQVLRTSIDAQLLICIRYFIRNQQGWPEITGIHVSCGNLLLDFQTIFTIIEINNISCFEITVNYSTCVYIL